MNAAKKHHKRLQTHTEGIHALLHGSAETTQTRQVLHMTRMLQAICKLNRIMPARAPANKCRLEEFYMVKRCGKAESSVLLCNTNAGMKLYSTNIGFRDIVVIIISAAPPAAPLHPLHSHPPAPPHPTSTRTRPHHPTSPQHYPKSLQALSKPEGNLSPKL
jgi:hypothetical protein